MERLTKLVATMVSFGLHNHPNRHRIYKHLVDGDIRELLRNFLSDLVPHDHAVPLSVTLSHDGQQLARALLSSLESEANDALNAMSAKDRSLGRDFPRFAAVGSAALSGVSTFAILANDDPVKIAG